MRHYIWTQKSKINCHYDLKQLRRNAKKEELLHQKHLEETKTIQALQNNNLHKGT